MKTVLIAGASGVVGRAAVEHFATLEGWRVIGVSRRVPEDMPTNATFLSVDLMDRAACEAALSTMSDVTHLIYAALYEKPGLLAGWQERDQMDTNLTMLDNLFTPLEAAAKGLQHVSLLQGTKAYGAHLRPVKVPARERWARDNHENFYWLQEDYLRVCQPGKDWAWTILRPQIVFGHAVGAPMNLLAAIGVYAAVMKKLGRPLTYPGGPPAVNEAMDANLLARMLEWAATSEECRNETFNATNGDVFVWPYIWPAIAAAFDMEAGDPAPMMLSQEMPKLSDVWDEIVREHGLKPYSMAELVGDSFIYADALMATGRDRAPPPVIVSTIKARQAGFADCIDTEDMFAQWFNRLRAMRILPPL